MGVCSYFVDKKNGRAFNLDKGSWYLLLPLTSCTPVEMRTKLKKAWSERGVSITEGAPPGFWENFAAHFWVFCEAAGWDVEFRCDANDYDDEGEHKSRYALVGSRVKEPLEVTPTWQRDEERWLPEALRALEVPP